MFYGLISVTLGTSPAELIQQTIAYMVVIKNKKKRREKKTHETASNSATVNR